MELDRLLVNHAGLTFRARGKCMYPTVRAGDVLRAQSCAIADVSIGDIAVFRRPSNPYYLFAHRIVGKGEHEGRPYIVTRPDGLRKGSDGPTFDENLLGIVSSIKRRNRSVPLQPVVYSRIMRGYLGVRILLMRYAWLFSWCAGALVRIQDSALYRHVAGRWFVLRRPHMKYTVCLPMVSLGNAVCRQVAPEDFDLRKCWRGRPIERWTLTLHINNQRDAAARVTLIKSAGETWAVDELYIRHRYRGSNLYRMLMCQVEDILRRQRFSQQLDEQGEDGMSSYAFR